MLKSILWGILVYVAMILIGLLPVNSHFKPAQDGIEISFVSTSIHADIILPIHTQSMDWRSQFSPAQFRGKVQNATHLAIGWGDREFFTQIHALSQLRLSKVLRALFWPSESCLQVSFIQLNAPLSHSQTVKLTESQYERLVVYIQNSFKLTPDGALIQITDAAYGQTDAFFEAHGAYHLFNTCNSWVGKGMQTAGIKTGWFTPLPKTMLWYLPN